jgi:site-specific DNA recombinase
MVDQLSVGKVHLYTRVSTDEQSRHGYSLGQQQHQLTEYAREHYSDRECVLWAEPGVSGSIPLDQRKQGREMVAALRAGDVLLVTKLDRIFRNTLDALTRVKHFAERQIAVVVLDIGSGSITETTDAGDKLQFQSLAIIAEFERNRHRERLLDSIEARRRDGRPLGKIRFGFRKEGKGREARVVEDERAQAILRLVYARPLSGRLLRQRDRPRARRRGSATCSGRRAIWPRR